MTDQQFQDVRDAIRLLESSKMTKVEGINWSVYKVGENIIRVDISRK